MATLNDVLKIARSRVGIQENPPNSNNVDCNTWYYGHPVNGSQYAWCCVEMMYVFHLAKADNLLTRTASCTTLMNWAKSKGKFSTTPKVGSLVFFNFDKNPDTKIAKHIGIVIEVKGDRVITIEGNTSKEGLNGSQDNGGCVAQRNRKFGKSIVGYVTIEYEGSTSKYPTLRQGMKNEYVKNLHTLLRKYSYGVDANSDYFDSTTKLCVINFQAVNNIQPLDGIVDDEVWDCLLKGDK